jgi:hypothetical protein
MILEELLKRLASGRPYNLTELAAELDVDLGLLEQMIIDLERGGYLKRVALSCSTICAGCPREGLCQITHEGRIWSVTDKGYRAALATDTGTSYGD